MYAAMISYLYPAGKVRISEKPEKDTGIENQWRNSLPSIAAKSLQTQ